jgi:hypothetical protein
MLGVIVLVPKSLLTMSDKRLIIKKRRLQYLVHMPHFRNVSQIIQA